MDEYDDRMLEYKNTEMDNRVRGIETVDTLDESHDGSVRKLT